MNRSVLIKFLKMNSQVLVNSFPPSIFLKLVAILTEYSGLEDELAAVGERWSHVCQWVEGRGVLLQDVAKDWNAFEEGWSKVESWLHAQDRTLYELEARVNPDSAHRTIVFLEARLRYDFD
jgi:hypothetical protein